MNHRIKELIEQAGFEEKDGHISIQGVYMFNTTRMEKLAELIVRECIDIVSPYAIRMENFDGGNPIADLKKHFGVEE